MGGDDLVDRVAIEILKAMDRMEPPAADDAAGRKTFAELIAVALDDRGMLHDPEPHMTAARD
jgi:hypothetical protein